MTTCTPPPTRPASSSSGANVMRSQRPSCSTTLVSTRPDSSARRCGQSARTSQGAVEDLVARRPTMSVDGAAGERRGRVVAAQDPAVAVEPAIASRMALTVRRHSTAAATRLRRPPACSRSRAFSFMARSTANGRRARRSLSTMSTAPPLSSSTATSSPMADDTQTNGVCGHVALRQLESGVGVESGKPVVGEDHVERLAAERFPEPPPVRRALPCRAGSRPRSASG